MFILRNVKLQGTYKKYNLTAIHVIKKKFIDLQLNSGLWSEVACIKPIS